MAAGVTGIWHGPIGWGLLGLAATGALAFWSYRDQLRQGRWQPWLLLGLIVLLILVINGINVAISFIACNIDNARVNHQSETFWRIVAIYGLALMMALPIRASQFYLIPRVGVLWRQWPSQAGGRPPLYGGELMFIPQNAHMLLGSLRQQLCYPQDPAAFSDYQLRAVVCPQLLRRRMGLISVGHRPSLRLHHDRLLELDGPGSWRLDPPADLL